MEDFKNEPWYIQQGDRWSILQAAGYRLVGAPRNATMVSFNLLDSDRDVVLMLDVPRGQAPRQTHTQVLMVCEALAMARREAGHYMENDNGYE